MAENSNIPVTVDAHKSNIKEVQQYLREIHYGGVNVTQVIPDGIFGEDTRAAVTDFQKLYGLEPTGEVNIQTWDAIFNVYDDIKRNNSPYGIDAFPSRETVFERGDSGTAILILQAMLNTIAGEFDNIYTNDLSGIYNDSTARAVAQLQSAAGISTTGNTDIRTWNMIVSIFNTFANDFE